MTDKERVRQLRDLVVAQIEMLADFCGDHAVLERQRDRLVHIMVDFDDRDVAR